MSSPSRVFGLVEDRRQEQLLYRYLICAGIRRDEIVINISPTAHGAAEQWVRTNFARFAKDCRRRNTRASTAMFVMLDADTQTVQERLDVLDRSLRDDGQQRFHPDRDPIARLIPRRNVETWILFLAEKGEAAPPIDEVIDYKHTKNSEEWSDLVPIAAQVLFEWTKPSAVPPANMIDSLHQGILEIRRVLPAER